MTDKNKLNTPHILLVSPLGMSKGLLYSALMQISCQACLVIASSQSVASLNEIQDKAGYQGVFYIKQLQDVFTGFSESETLVEECKDFLLKADQIVCNITGGTTAQQFAVQAIYEKAKELKKTVRRIALIDRRDALEQRNTPYIVGEKIELN